MLVFMIIAVFGLWMVAVDDTVGDACRESVIDNSDCDQLLKAARGYTIAIGSVSVILCGLGSWLSNQFFVALRNESYTSMLSYEGSATGDSSAPLLSAMSTPVSPQEFNFDAPPSSPPKPSHSSISRALASSPSSTSPPGLSPVRVNNAPEVRPGSFMGSSVFIDHEAFDD